MGRTAEETEQNRNYVDCPKKMDSKKKIPAGKINAVCTESRGREKSHGTSKKWLKPPLAGASHTHEVDCPFRILG